MKKVRLGEVCDIYAGTGFPIEYQGNRVGTYPFYKVGDISRTVSCENKYLGVCDNYINDEIVKIIKGTIIPKETIVFAKIGEAIKLNRRAITSCNCLIDNNVMGIKPNFKFLDLNYFYYYMCDLKLEVLAESTTVPSVKKSVIEKLEIPYLEINEQQKIASILDKVSDLIALRKQQLAKLDELVKSRFVEMFGDPKLNPKCYLVNNLSNYIVFLTSGSRGWAKYCKNGGSEWFITIKNVKDCHISVDNMQEIEVPDNAEAKRTKVKEDDLLISITADLGRTGVVTKEIADHGAYINQHLICIRLKKEILNPLYVAYFMESDAGKEQFILKNNSAVKAGLNFNSINTLSLMVPPISEQTRFIAFVKHVDKSKFEFQKSLDELNLLKKSLMQEYFG